MSDINYSRIKDIPLVLSEIRDNGAYGLGFRHMSIMLTDFDGNKYIANFNFCTIYDDQMKKAFRRIRPCVIGAPAGSEAGGQQE